MKRIRSGMVAGLMVVVLAGTGCGPWTSTDPLHDGIAALQKNRYRRAERLLNMAAAQEPANATAHAHLAVALWKRGVLPDAIASMQRAVDLSPDDARPAEYLGLLLLEARRDAEAIEVLEAAAARSPDDPRLLTALAVARWRMGDTAFAADRLAGVLEKHRDYGPAVFNTAIFHRDQRRDPQQARLFFERYAVLAPNGDRAGEARQALARLDREIARQSNSHAAGSTRPTTALRSPFESSSPQLMNRANAAIQRGDFDEAYIHLRDAVRYDENDAQAVWTMAEFTEKHLEASARAARVWRDFLQRFPDDPRVGEARQRLRRMETASAGSPDREHPDSAAAPAAGSGMPITAQLFFNRAARRDPENSRRAFLRGTQFQQDGDWDRAIYFFTRAIEQDDSQVNAFIQLARVYESNGDLSLAVEACEQALRLHPDLVEARLQQVRLLIRLGASAQAQARLESLLQREPDLAQAHLLMGFLLKDQPARQAQARRHFQRYLDAVATGDMSDRVRRWLDGEGEHRGVAGDL